MTYQCINILVKDAVEMDQLIDGRRKKMMNKCRFPGCTVEMQTLHGREMHEAICHGISQEWMAGEIFAQVQALSNLGDVDVPETQLLAYTQDLIVIEEAMGSLENSCCS